MRAAASGVCPGPNYTHRGMRNSAFLGYLAWIVDCNFLAALESCLILYSTR